MFIDQIKEIAGQKIHHPGVMENVIKKVLIGPKQGWEGWTMRQFDLAANGFTPRHTHPWPHINYVISGQGLLYLDGHDYEVGPGSIAYVPDNVEHQFKNIGSEDFSFICIVPEEGDK
ncbi:MAG TPA: cupin domain-containing protein [Syntrophomonas sp.]|nr:cupin domain-containing protein [Syntrophomonas sp.]HRW12625.1 cupin domain-containing protein [Syntrophomonas sp.]